MTVDRWVSQWGGHRRPWQVVFRNAEWEIVVKVKLMRVQENRHHFADQGLHSQSCGFSSSHVWLWEWDHKESWALKNWCFRTVVMEKTLESPLDCKEIKPVHPKGDQSWVFIGRTDAEAESLILWLLDGKNWFIGEDPDAGKGWGQKETGATEDEMVGWHHWLNQHEFEQTQGEWRTGKLGVLQFRVWRTGKLGVLGSQRAGHDLATEQQKQEKTEKEKLEPASTSNSQSFYIYIHMVNVLFWFYRKCTTLLLKSLYFLFLYTIMLSTYLCSSFWKSGF